MSTITDVRCVLSQKAFDTYCEKFHIPEEVHPVLPDRGNTMHERPIGKIGLYTRFFDFANFRLHMSTFLVDILRMDGCLSSSVLINLPYAIRNLLTLSKIGMITCPARFPWHTAKNVTRDPAPVAADFNVQDYATLVAHPSPFRKFPGEFLCLVGLIRHYTLDEETYPLFLAMLQNKVNRGQRRLTVVNDDQTCQKPSNLAGNMDIFAFIHTSDPTKVKVVERERKEDEPQLLKNTVGRTVPLLLVAPDRGESELDASPRRLKKRKTIVADVGGPSHPSKKTREDHETPSGVFVGGKSRSAVQRLFARAVQNVKVRGESIPTMPFVTSSVSATPEREGEGHTDSVTRLNLRTINAPQRFVISSYSSHHSGANIVEAEVDSFFRPFVPVITATTTITSTTDHVVVVKEKIVEPSLFAAESTSAGGTDPAMAGLTDLTGNDFLVGGIRIVINPDSDLQKTYVPQWNVTNNSRLDDGGVCREMVDETEMKKLRILRHIYCLKEAKVVEAIRLCDETFKLETAKKSLRDEVYAFNERNTIHKKERNALDVKVTNLEAVVVSKERELTDSTTRLTFIKSQNDNLVDQVSSFELKGKLSNYENLTKRLEEFQDAQLKVINDNFDKLYTDFVEMSLHLEERFYLHLLTTIARRIWLLTYGMELAVVKCLNSLEYLYALRTAISKAVEKGMHDGLAVGITHGKEGRVLTDVAAHNPSTESDYVSALQQLQGVNFPLLAELKANKDTSIEVVMNILRLEEHLAERWNLNESQPHADQLMVPIHYFPDKTVIGDSALLLALDVSNVRVRRIRENIMIHSIVDPISIDDYEVTGTDDQPTATKNVADDNASLFPNVDDAELNIP
nr:transposase (putative), gypsy type [Tanacetum cinerariifolium]